MKFLQAWRNIKNHPTADAEKLNTGVKMVQERYADNGIFTYNAEGFTIRFKDGIHTVKWNEIKRLVAYKLDLMTTDEIRLDICYDEYKITISEETKGWYQFVERAKIIFSIDKDWDSKIAQPPFATNLTILYDKG